jgi:hypothetical protein
MRGMRLANASRRLSSFWISQIYVIGQANGALVRKARRQRVSELEREVSGVVVLVLVLVLLCPMGASAKTASVRRHLTWRFWDRDIRAYLLRSNPHPQPRLPKTRKRRPNLRPQQEATPDDTRIEKPLEPAHSSGSCLRPPWPTRTTTTSTHRRSMASRRRPSRRRI